MLEVGVQAQNQQYGTRYFCVIPTNIYGTNDNFNLTEAHVIPALIHKVYLARQNNTILQIPGDGSALREFVFAADVAHIVEQLLEKYEGTSPLIISSGVEISIKQVLEMIIELMHYKGKIEWQTNLTNGQHRKPSDISKLKSVLPGLQFTGIYEGLKETINWFEGHYEGVRK
jgi:GDP-L-fucose synthase